jgi:hypothetical protein
MLSLSERFSISQVLISGTGGTAVPTAVASVHSAKFRYLVLLGTSRDCNFHTFIRPKMSTAKFSTSHLRVNHMKNVISAGTIPRYSSLN